MDYGAERAGTAPPPVILSALKDLLRGEAKNPHPVPVILSALKDLLRGEAKNPYPPRPGEMNTEDLRLKNE